MNAGWWASSISATRGTVGKSATRGAVGTTHDARYVYLRGVQQAFCLSGSPAPERTTWYRYMYESYNYHSIYSPNYARDSFFLIEKLRSKQPMCLPGSHVGAKKEDLCYSSLFLLVKCTPVACVLWIYTCAYCNAGCK